MNILLVEDDQDSRNYLGRFLCKIGHRTVSCDNGHDALQLFKSMEFHMVLTDLKMPGMSGIELLKNITSFPDRAIPVVLFTGHGDMPSAIEALRAGAYDYLLKPINIEEITMLIERLAEHLYLKKGNKIPTEKFEEKAKAATEESRRELLRIKMAYARLAGVGEIGIFSDSLRLLFEQAAKLHCDRSIPVLIQGETGTGKEIIAKFVHYGSNAHSAPFIDINCAAFPPNIFESELFGYEAGAFTGGLPKGQKGKLDMAQGGTIFLDEITELPLELQAKLLRVFQEKEYYRVGGLKKIKTDVRIICATNTDLKEKVIQGQFRQDLYYRLNVGQMFLPPLRERKNEILPLAEMFLRRFANERRKQFTRINDAAAQMLTSYHWPGNIRELMNVIQFIVFSYNDLEIKPEQLYSLPEFSAKNEPRAEISFKNCPLPVEGLDLEVLCDDILLRALKMHNWNKTKTASYLGITRRTLYYRLQRLSEGKSHKS